MRLDKDDNNQEFYKKACEASSIEKTFCPWRFEHQMEVLFENIKDDMSKGMAILDACCGSGRLLHFMLKAFPNCLYTGIDYSQSLIDEAAANFKESKNISFNCCDLMNLPNKYEKSFDISINYKTLAWLPYYEDLVISLIKATKKRIYLTSLFQNADIDIICKFFRNTSVQSKDFSYLNTYSIKKFENFCKKNGATEVKSIDLNIPFDLGNSDDIDSDVPKTYTVRVKNEDVLEFTSIIRLKWKLVEITL